MSTRPLAAVLSCAPAWLLCFFAQPGRCSAADSGAINVMKAVAAKAMVEVGWPTQWQVFGPLSPQFTRPVAEQLKTIPAELTIDGKTCAPRTLTERERPLPHGYKGTVEQWRSEAGTMEALSVVDLKPLWLDGKAGKNKERLGAYAFAAVDCPADGTLYVNCGADWWMQWYVDGRDVYSTMDGGNLILPELICKRGFAVPVSKGKHVVAALVQSGSGGWLLASRGAFSTKGPDAMKDFFQPWITIFPEERMPTAMPEDKTVQPAPPIVGTEVQRLMERVKAPARFAGCKPKFAIRPEDQAYELSSRRQEFVKACRYAVYDGERIIGDFARHFVAGLRVDYCEFFPTGSWKLVADNGTKPTASRRDGRLLVGGPLDLQQPAEPHWGWAVTDGGRSASVRQWWTPKPQATHPWRLYEVTSTFRVDPVCGYVVDSNSVYVADRPPLYLWTGKAEAATSSRDGSTATAARDAQETGTEYCNVLPSHLSFHCTRGAFDWRYERTFYTPRGTDKYVGWINDTWQAQSSDDHGLYFRPDGFVGFAVDPLGWGQAHSFISPNREVGFNNATCWLLQDQHCGTAVRKPTLTDGRYRLRIQYRLHLLPPEVMRHILDRMELMPMRDEVLTIHQDETQYFESDSRQEAAASPWTAGVQIADGQGRSGKRSVVLRNAGDGRRGPTRPRRASLRIDAQPPMAPGATYRLEAWVKAEGAGSSVSLAAQPIANHARPSADADWKPVVSAAVTPGGEWRQVELTFTTPPYHGFAQRLYLQAEIAPGGAVYVDDVSIARK